MIRFSKVAMLGLVLVGSHLHAQDDGGLADANRQFANPLANTTLWIMENNLFFFDGDAVSSSKRNNAFIIDPLLPMSIGKTGKWNLVHRPILPIFTPLRTPDGTGGADVEQGIGDFTYFAAFTPPATPVGESGRFIWGAGPIARFPTGGSDRGAEKYSIGAMAVALYSGEKFSFGALNQNLFSVAGESDRSSVNSSTLQYFYFYNFSPKWGIGAAPTISIDWKDSENNAIPIGIGITRSFMTGKTPNRLLLEVDYYLDQNDAYGPEWNIRLAWARFLPKFFD